MQRKVMLSLAVVFCLAASAQAALSIVNTNHSYNTGTTQVVIPIQISSTAPATTDQTANFTAVFEIALPSFVAGPGLYPSGPSPIITFQGNATPYVDATGDFTGNFMATTAHANDFTTGNDDSWNFEDGQNVNQSTPANISPLTNGGLLLNLLVDFTGFNTVPGTWRIIMDATNGNGPTTMGNLAGPLALDLSQANFTVSIVPEPSSVVLGLFAAAGLGMVAIRKRRARRA